MTNARVRRLSDAELDRAAEITPADLVEDVIFWREHGSPLTNAFLDAKPDPDADAAGEALRG